MAVALGLAGAEAGMRAFALDQYPLYNVYSSGLGYLPKPNQRGAYAHRNTWVFNERSMATARAYASSPNDILLIGDSLILGGVQQSEDHRQEDRLGPALERATGRRVWPVGAGSWGIQNELRWLKLNPDHAPTVVFVLNSRDFGPPSVAQGEYAQPTRKPLSILAYTLGQKIDHTPALDPPENDAFAAPLAQFLAGSPGRVVYVLHQRKGEAFPFTLLRQHAGRGSVCETSLPDALYMDAIHPKAAGYAELSRQIGECLSRQAVS